MKKDYVILLVLLTCLVFMGCSSKSKERIQESRHNYNLIDKLHNPNTSRQNKISIIEELGYKKDPAVIPELNKVLMNNNEIDLWMNAAESLEKLGVKNAVEAQKEYEKIVDYEKSYYYNKGKDSANSTQESDPKEYQKIINKFSAWISRFPDHPRVPNIKMAIKYFEEKDEKITIEKVCSNPKKYISKIVEWQGIIKDINMQDDKVKLLFLTGDKKWAALLNANKFIPELYTIGSNIKVQGDIIEIVEEKNNEIIIKIPVIHAKNIW
ncbi:hypothetical protein HZA55_01270 [Candidatus Poribacteria bacterium]|nr:hypothetical protein [Candidatus Poribacteria bacterium]